MNKISYEELCNAMRTFNEVNNVVSCGGCKQLLKGVIVITEDSFNQSYTLEERSYVVNNDNKAWISGMLGYSIYGSSLDGVDRNVRLENYLACERGGKNGWKIDYCYLLKEGA